MNAHQVTQNCCSAANFALECGEIKHLITSSQSSRVTNSDQRQMLARAGPLGWLPKPRDNSKAQGIAVDLNVGSGLGSQDASSVRDEGLARAKLLSGLHLWQTKLFPWIELRGELAGILPGEHVFWSY